MSFFDSLLHCIFYGTYRDTYWKYVVGNFDQFHEIIFHNFRALMTRIVKRFQQFSIQSTPSVITSDKLKLAVAVNLIHKNFFSLVLTRYEKHRVHHHMHLRVLTLFLSVLNVIVLFE